LLSAAIPWFIICTVFTGDVFLIQVVQTFERIVVFRLGRLLDSKGPGPCNVQELSVISMV